MSDMDDFQRLKDEIDNGLSGKNVGLPMGFDRLSKYVSIRKRIYTLVFGATGCISKDTKILFNRGDRHSGRIYTIEEIYNKQNGLDDRQGRVGRRWSPNIEKVMSYKKDVQAVGFHKIQRVVRSGNKRVYELITETGKGIKTSKDHLFLVDAEKEEYKKLEDLKVGDYVICRSEKYSKAKGRTISRRDEYIGRFPYYWTCNKRKVKGYIYERVYKYRVAYDAKINGLSEEDFLKEVKENPNHTLVLSDRSSVIHHKNGNPLDNSPDNLCLLPKKEHDRLHMSWTRRSDCWVQEERIVSIDDKGIEMTYDIICEDPYRNFLANDFVVHNSGKSALVHSAFILNPFEYYHKHLKESDFKFKVILFSMERGKVYTFAKWISRKIFLDTGILIPISKMLGWWKKEKLSKEEYELIMQYQDYLAALLEVVDFKEGSMGPGAIYKHVLAYAQEHGKIEQVTEHHKIYIPNNPNEIVIPMIDHQGLIRTEKGFPTKKEAIDQTSAYMQYFRDFFGYSPVIVSQMNRDKSSPMYQKMSSFEPSIDDIKESGRPGEDAECIMSLFDPIRYHTADASYDAEAFQNKSTGGKFFRSVKILKNTFGEDDIRIGMAFHGATGTFAELPKPTDMTDFDYSKVFSGEYFIKALTEQK